MDQSRETPSRGPRYKWPGFVLAAVILAVVLAVLWMSVAVRRTRELRDPNSMPSLNGPASK